MIDLILLNEIILLMIDKLFQQVTTVILFEIVLIIFHPITLNEPDLIKIVTIQSPIHLILDERSSIRIQGILNIPHLPGSTKLFIYYLMNTLFPD